MAEGKLRGKEDSTAPADAMGKVLEVEPISDEGEQKFVERGALGLRQRVGRGARSIGKHGTEGSTGDPGAFRHGLGKRARHAALTRHRSPRIAMGRQGAFTRWFRHFAYSASVNLAYEAMED